METLEDPVARHFYSRPLTVSNARTQVGCNLRSFSEELFLVGRGALLAGLVLKQFLVFGAFKKTECLIIGASFCHRIKENLIAKFSSHNLH